MDIPFGNVVVLLLYLLPGFLAMQLYRARYPAKRISQFEVVVWSVFHSFVVQLGIAGIAKVLGTELAFLNQGASSEIHPTSIAILVSGGFVWGGVLIAFHWLRIKVEFLPSPDPQAIWPVVAGGAPAKQLWALVRTKQGALYLGWIERYSFDPAAEDHEFLLRPAFVVDSGLVVTRRLEEGGVYLNTRDVESLEMMRGR